MTTRNPLVRRDGKIIELPTGDNIAGAQAGTPGEDGAPGDTGATGPAGLNALQYSTNIGDGASTTIAVTHNLGTKDVTVTVIKNSDDSVLNDPTWVATSSSVVTFTFGAAPTTNQYRVIILTGASSTGFSISIDNYFV